MWDIQLVVSVCVCWLGFSILWYFYNKIHYPFIRVIDFDKRMGYVELLISHNMNKVPIRLHSVSQTFYFEGYEYFWSAEHDNPNEVFTLCINKKGRLKEVFRVDFTNHKIEIEHAV